jgi:hypothetical protein
VITEFKGDYDFLSNFYRAEVNYRGIAYPTSEHAYQAMKTTDPGDRKTIASASTPRLAKTMGRGVDLSPDWEQLKKMYMLEILLAKFRQHGTLLAKLLDTGDRLLIEGNTWHDNYWGVCSCKSCVAKAVHLEIELGTNMLGKLLMVTRAVYRPDA